MKYLTISILGAMLALLVTSCGKESITKTTVKKVTPLVSEPRAEAGPPPNQGAAPSQEPATHFTYDKPEAWTDQGASGMRAASFVAGSDDAAVQISVIRLGGAAGGLLPNVNRWRGQLGLDPIAMEDLKLEEVNLAEASAQVVEMESVADGDTPAQAAVVAITEHGGSSWFIKMTGPKDSVQAQRPNFDLYIKSVRFAH
ncbi:MAG: hypothetical protein ACI9TH_002677 [Kiritimatiellia bacterium]|jgi:hypothetical protein